MKAMSVLTVAFIALTASVAQASDGSNDITTQQDTTSMSAAASIRGPGAATQMDFLKVGDGSNDITSE